MNVSGPLLLLLLTACTVSGQGMARALPEFAFMISCVQPGLNPFTWTQYLDYGCYCGLGGQGTPVDDLDMCCKVHDDCYGACMKSPDCSGFSHDFKPYYMHYLFTCSTGQATCLSFNSKCRKAICECDRAAALCFARTKYNPQHKLLDRKLCEK